MISFWTEESAKAALECHSETLPDMRYIRKKSFQPTAFLEKESEFSFYSPRTSPREEQKKTVQTQVFHRSGGDGLVNIADDGLVNKAPDVVNFMDMDLGQMAEAIRQPKQILGRQITESASCRSQINPGVTGPPPSYRAQSEPSRSEASQRQVKAVTAAGMTTGPQLYGSEIPSDDDTIAHMRQVRDVPDDDIEEAIARERQIRDVPREYIEEEIAHERQTRDVPDDDIGEDIARICDVQRYGTYETIAEAGAIARQRQRRVSVDREETESGERGGNGFKHIGLLMFNNSPETIQIVAF